MDFLGARLANHLHQFATGRAAHERIVHNDDLLPLQHLAHGVELDLHLGVAGGLRGIDERAAHVVVADQSVLELESRLFGKSERHRIGRIGHGEDAIGAWRWMLARELAPKRATYAIDRTPEDRAVGPREVDELKD